MTDGLFCPSGHPNQVSARFCRKCGLPLGPPDAGVAENTRAVPAQQATLPPHPTSVVAPPPAVYAAPAGTPYPPAPGNPQPAPAEKREAWPIVVIVALAVLVVGLGGAIAAIALAGKSSSAPTTIPISTSVPTTTPSTTAVPTSTTNAAAATEAQAMSALLGNSAVDRSQIVSAVQQVTSCGDLSGAQSTLDQAASSRQSLLEQLAPLQVGGLSTGPQLVRELQAAWQASVSSDRDYAAYAGDELSSFNGCTPNDSGDPNAQAAATSDAQATAAKGQFVALWNPIAASFGLPQWQASSL